MQNYTNKFFHRLPLRTKTLTGNQNKKTQPGTLSSVTNHLRLQFAPATAGYILSTSLLSTALMVAPALQAAEFELGETGATATLNTTFSIGTKYGLEKYHSPADNDQNKNDGYKSFDGGFVSDVLKITPELDIKKDNLGAFIRATAYYDHVLMNGPNKWHENNKKDIANGLADEDGTFPGWSDEVKHNQGKGAKFQRAYLYADWTFSGGQKLSVKLGDQTHDWGTNLFYCGGLKDLNAYDLALYSLPGASKDDLLLGQGMLKAEFAFNDQISVGGFTQYKWKKSILNGRGAFKGHEIDTDIFVPGSEKAYYDLPTFAKGLTGGDLDALKTILKAITVPTTGDMFQVADISAVKSARDSGQWGVNVTFKPEFLKDTEFALYYANYHSGLPTFNARIDLPALKSGATTLSGNATAFIYLEKVKKKVRAQMEAMGITDEAKIAEAVDGSRQKAENTLLGMYMLNKGASAETVYGEDIKVWGASFRTKVFGYTRIAGELSYTENLPIWIDHPDDLIANLVLGVPALSKTGTIEKITQANIDRSYTLGTSHDNFVRTPVWDGSLSVIQPFGAVLGTDLMYVVGEVAGQQVSGLKDYDTFTAKNSNGWFREKRSDNAHDRLDRFSWGYNLMLGANWKNVVKPGVEVKSTLRFTHDVSGNSHRTGRFEEGEKKLNIGLTAFYEDLSATLSWGGNANDMGNGVIAASLNYKL